LSSLGEYTNLNEYAANSYFQVHLMLFILVIFIFYTINCGDYYYYLNAFLDGSGVPHSSIYGGLMSVPAGATWPGDINHEHPMSQFCHTLSHLPQGSAQINPYSTYQLSTFQ